MVPCIGDGNGRVVAGAVEPQILVSILCRLDRYASQVSMIITDASICVGP